MDTTHSRHVRRTNIWLCIWVATVLTVTAGCQPGKITEPIATETRAISPFDAVVLSTNGAMTIVPGDREHLTITAAGNVLPWIETVVQNDVLHAEWKANAPGFPPETPITYTLTAPTLQYVTVTDAGQIEANDVNADRVEVTMAGTGQITMRGLQAVDLAADLDGTGRLEFAGQVTTQDISIPGSGQYSAAELASRDTSIGMAGPGHAVVQASELLDVRITGPGVVEYYGDPRVGLYVTGGGVLTRLGEK